MGAGNVVLLVLLRANTINIHSWLMAPKMPFPDLDLISGSQKG